jgi:predicted nucleotide-binding protein (sugar kinase/HSP70/actin superfamily)
VSKILIGGLTQAHEILIKGLFEHIGFEVICLPEPDNEALKIGKIYCNKGQCNPIYYTAGSIIKYLFHLKERRVRDIEKNYLFVTAGSCGPCRFGMYETEYRKAVKDAGFPEFRIIALQQDEALLNHLREMGFTLKRTAFLSLLRSFVLADLINNIYYKTKPYEVEKGSIDRWKMQSLDRLYKAIRKGERLVIPLRQVRNALSAIQTDYFRLKPKVKITGEFFSQMQEGDANYRLPGWLIEEGAEPLVEPITTWLDYILRTKIQFISERAFRGRYQAGKLIMILFSLKLYIHVLYTLYRKQLCQKPDPLKSQKKLARYAQNYYSTKLLGGEGHLEVGKHIYSVAHGNAHLVISVKPFGCMSSTQSDGVQTKVSHDMDDSLFVTVDTSGDAEVNFKSRVLMKLHEARERALSEFEFAKKKLDLSSRQIALLKEGRPDLKKASRVLPRKGISTAVKVLYLIS